MEWNYWKSPFMVYLFLLLMVHKIQAWLMTENFGISIFALAMKEKEGFQIEI